MSCNTPDGAPCFGGDGAACLAPGVVESSHLEPSCDLGIEPVPVVLLSPDAATVSLLWYGVNAGDTLEYVLKSIEENSVLFIGLTTDVAYDVLGQEDVTYALPEGTYMVAMRRLQDGAASPWVTSAQYYNGVSQTTFLDGDDFVVDGLAEDIIIE